ncbi:MAG: hypothetical protein SGI74_05940 [Oligoflexia bacterium]|nr:hypothetical protein [Oligoflexia bacterium]
MSKLSFIKEWPWGRLLSVILLASFFVVVLDSDLRSQARSVFRPQYRVILAVASADLINDGKSLQILKVKTDEGLFLEVYDPQKMLSSIRLPDKKDGYFTFNGSVTNLAIDDIDNDNKLEILATSFDSDLVAHLNVYRYVPGNKELELVKIN